MMQEVQGFVFTAFCLCFSLLFHLSLTVRLVSIAPRVGSIAYTRIRLNVLIKLCEVILDFLKICWLG